jgi:hypothetical protein
MLHGAGMDFKYWPWAFSHFLVLHNVLPHGDRGIPMVRIGGRTIEISNLRTFGCYVCVRPPGCRPSKLELHVNNCRFLGYTTTWTQIHYLDLRTNRIKTSVHVRYDEGMSELKVPTPNSRQLLAALGRPLPAKDDDTPDPVDCGLVAVSSPLQTLVTVTVPIRCDSPTLGLTLATYAARSRAFIQDITPKSTCSKIRDWRRKYRGAYIIQIDDNPVFSLSDAKLLLIKARDLAPQSETHHLTLIVAPDTPPSVSDAALGTPRLGLDHFRTVIHALYEMGEGHAMPEAAEIPQQELETLACAIYLPDGMVPGSKWRRRKLSSLPCWPEWYASEKTRLDEMDLAKMFGPPVPRTPGTVVFRTVWSYTVKHDGRKKVRQNSTDWFIGALYLALIFRMSPLPTSVKNCTLIMYKSNNVHIWIMLCMIMFSAHCVMYIIATLF